MSEQVLRDLVARMATDRAFAEQVRSDPQGTAAAYGLTREQVDQLNALVATGADSGPSMLDARLSKSALFFGGGLDLHAGSLAGDIPAVPTASDHGIVDSGNGGHGFTAFSDSALQAGIQDDSVHIASIESTGMVSLLPTIDHSGQTLGVETSFAGSDKGFEDLGLHGAATTSAAGITGITPEDGGFEDLGLRTDKGIEDVALSKTHTPLDLDAGKAGPELPTLTASDKGIEDFAIPKIHTPLDMDAAKAGPELPTLSADQADKAEADPAA